jgi:hypothetical protein
MKKVICLLLLVLCVALSISVSSIFVFFKRKSHNITSPVPIHSLSPTHFIPQNYNGTNWMTVLFENSPELLDFKLNEMIIPGTHDSLTGCLYDKSCQFQYDWVKEKWLNKELVDIIAPKYVITQRLSPINQILEGVRYLDLRLWWNGTDWYGVHGLKDFATTFKIEDFIEQIRDKFISKNNREVLILNFDRFLSDDSTPPTFQDLENLALNTSQILGSSLIPVSTNILSYNEVFQNKSGNKVLIIWSDTIPNQVKNVFWNSSILNDCWAGHHPSGSDPQLNCCPDLPIKTWNKIQNCYIKPQMKQIYQNNFKNTQAHYQQPDIKTIKDILEFLEQITKSLVDRADTINEQLIKFLPSVTTKGSLNVVTMDGWKEDYLEYFYNVNQKLVTSYTSSQFLSK